MAAPIETLISNLTYINYCGWLKLNESIIDYVKQLRQLSRKNFEYFDSMTDSLLKSLETNDEKNVVYLTGFLKGYESGRDDAVARLKKDEQVVEIPEKKEIRGDSKEVTYFYM